MAEVGKPFLEYLHDEMAKANLPVYTGPLVTAGKQGYLVQLTDEQAANIYPVRLLPPEEVAAKRAARLEEDKAYVRGITMRLATAHPALTPIIELHGVDNTGTGLYCLGCDAGAYAEDSPSWPCSTIELILEGLGPHVARREVACGKRYMDGRNEVRCWLAEAHDGECK